MTMRDATLCFAKSVGMPEHCAGTDAGGNCKLMRDVPWDERTCWFNSDIYADSPQGQAEQQAYWETWLAECRKTGRCSNCGGMPEEHHEDGSCPTYAEILGYDLPDGCEEEP